MSPTTYSAIYDFELLPYALGDVLTWNVQTAIRCEELGRERVDIHICLDPRTPASIYQRGTITAENCELYFNELYGAFGTHSRLGTIAVYRRREDLLDHLRPVMAEDPENGEVLADYEQALANRDDEAALNAYFLKYVYFHERINAFAAARGHVPLLQPSLGCAPDVDGVEATLFAGKKVVAVHFRLRRLDAGLGGEHTYHRDSDFLEWYDFIRRAEVTHPDVQFLVLGRLQEKPLEILKLPNVTSLRLLGLGLGHELTMLLRSDLFIGTSSGFAAMANFSELPYFITRMNAESCNAYRIENGADRLPFASERQLLIYEPETTDMLTGLLNRGLENVRARPGAPAVEPKRTVNVERWARDQTAGLAPNALTSRFFSYDNYADREAAFLLWPKLQEAMAAWRDGARDDAVEIVRRIEENFPRLRRLWPELIVLRGSLSLSWLGSRPLARAGWRLRRAAGRVLRRIMAPLPAQALRFARALFAARRMTTRHVYTSGSREPLSRLISPLHIARHLTAHWELIATFARRDFQAAHRGTYLGFAWTVISPLIMLALFTAVFGGVFKGRFSTSPDETALDFAVALFVGLSLFQAVAQTLGTAPSLVQANATYVKTLSFPVEIIPVASVFNILISLAINLTVCVIAFLALNGSLHWTVVFLPLHMLCVALFCLGIAWLISALAVFVRDVVSVIPPVTLVLMFWSLVFFPISAVPEAVRWTVQINPLSTIVEQARGAVMFGTVPDPVPLIVIMMVAVVFAIASYCFFMRAKPAFADVL